VFRFPNCTCYAEQMRDVVEYLRAYRGYISANLGWGKALRFVGVWIAGMFVPWASKTLFELPNWVAVTWMIVWAFLGYIFAPYGMWKTSSLKSARPKISAAGNSLSFPAIRQRRSAAFCRQGNCPLSFCRSPVEFLFE
jgi:hypothetical protein